MGDNVRPQTPDLQSRVRTAGLTRRVRFTRSHSTLSLQNADTVVSPRIKRHEPRDIARGGTQLDDLRELAKFLCATAPPNRLTTRDDCLDLSGSRASKRPSIRSFFSTPRRAISLARSLQLRVSENAASGSTAEEHQRVAMFAPDQRDTDGSWSRSRDLDFKSNGTSRLICRHSQWPERTTSRGALSPTFPGPEPDFSSCGMENQEELPASPAGTINLEEPVEKLPDSIHHDYRPSRAEDSLIVQTSHSLSDAASMETSKPSQMKIPGVTVELPASPPLTGLFDDSGWSEVTMKSTVSPPAAGPKSLLDRRRQPSLSSPIVKSTLIVPKQNLLPDSPGFPNMLAAMTFPTPPRSSRSPSLSSSTSSRAPSPITVRSMPVVQSRTSSRHAVTRSGPTSSLNDVVMKPRAPSVLDARSDYITRASHIYSKSMSLATSPLGDLRKGRGAGAQSVTPRTQSPHSLVDDTTMTRPESVASYVTASETPVHSASPSIGSIAESHRQSTGSNTTTTTDSKRRSTPSSDTTRHSNRSNATTTSCAPTNPDDDIKMESTEWNPNLQPATPIGSKLAEDKTSLGQRRRSRDDSSLAVLQNAYAPASASVVTTKHVEQQNMSLSQRRNARKGKSNDETGHGLDLARLGFEVPGVTPIGLGPDSAPKDSPVLGWFPHSGGPRSSSLRRRSPLVPICSTSIATALSELDEESFPYPPNSTGTATPSNREATSRHEIPKKAVTTPSHTTKNNQWTMSSMMTTEITPEAPFDRLNRAPSNVLTMSPIIVVADLEPSEPRLPHPTATPRVSIATSPDSSSPTPNPPPRSPFRTAFNTMPHTRKKPLPIKIPKITPTSVAERRTSVLHYRSGHSASISTPPLTPRVKSSHRLSLPLSNMPLNTPSAVCDQDSTSQQREPLSVQQPVLEPVQRRRSVVVRERFQKERIEKERELLELIAKSSENHASRRERKPAAADDDDDQTNYMKDQMRTTHEIEQRIQRLEKNGDAWLSALDPMLKNMTRTLTEIRKEGKGNPLLMGEFSIDMAAEARRSMYYSRNADVTSKPKSLYFEGFDGAHERVHSVTPRSADGKKMRGGQSPSKLSRLRLQSDQPIKNQLAKSDWEKSDLADVPVEAEPQEPQPPPAPLPEPPRTPQEHDFAVQVAIRRRIQEQEAMMEDLSNRWGHLYNSQDGPSTPKQRRMSRRSSRRESRRDSRRDSRKNSSLDTIRTSHKESSGANTEQKAAPLSQYWAKNTESGNDESRRHSRRWSSAGERTSWRYGDNSGMDFLMEELMDTSRLSLESMSDLESTL